MTDKQIKEVFKNGFYCIEPCPEIKELQAELKRKEQECEKLETARHLIETSRYNWEYRAKSKERECESLNRWLPIISRLEMDFGSYEKAKAIDFASYTKQIFAELGQLKEQLETYKMEAEEGKEINAELKAENKHLNDLLNQALKELEKTRETLTEIKEIAEKIDDSDGCAYGDYDCDNCSSLEQETICTYKVKKLILQKISECEGNDENN